MFQVFDSPLRPSRVTTSLQGLLPWRPLCVYATKNWVLEPSKNTKNLWFLGSHCFQKKKQHHFLVHGLVFPYPCPKKGDSKINPFCNPMKFKLFFVTRAELQSNQQNNGRHVGQRKLMFLPRCMEVPGSFYLVSIGRIFQIIPKRELFGHVWSFWLRIHLQSPPFGGITWSARCSYWYRLKVGGEGWGFYCVLLGSFCKRG